MLDFMPVKRCDCTSGISAVLERNMFSLLITDLVHEYSDRRLPSGAFWAVPSAQPLFLNCDLTLPSKSAYCILTVSIPWPYAIYLDHWLSPPFSSPSSSWPVDNHLGVVKLTFSSIFNMEIGQEAGSCSAALRLLYLVPTIIRETERWELLAVGQIHSLS